MDTPNNISDLIAEAREDAANALDGWPVEMAVETVRTFCDRLELAEAELAELHASMASYQQMCADYQRMCAGYEQMCASYERAFGAES